MGTPPCITWPSARLVDFSLGERCHIPTRALTTFWARLHRSTILSVLGLDHSLTVLFLGTHTRTSQWVNHHGNVLARTRLTSEFRWNPKPVRSQKASC
ncbi:hypothetical protein DVH24_004249 [Malus domestica]|uniref:Uncharacterized protein n=1 Tax=Malus domestica TaxID=3750 RepID=A0A498K8J5_MALDO|nr:hypothetical protein DVH24_004249 [Malus domestica]